MSKKATSSDPHLVDLENLVGGTEEFLFGALARAGGAVVNRVSQDLLGWDYHLQLPRTPSTIGHALDARPPEASCFVQVKTTVKSRRSWSIRLSVWERLTKERRPVFFFVALLHPSTKHLQTAFLVHLGPDLMAEVLRELRSVPTDEASALHKRSLALRWAEKDKVVPLTGARLREMIAHHIGSDILGYEQEKQRLLQTLGYPKHPIRFTFNVVGSSADEVHRMLAEFSVGLRTQLPVELTRLTSERFGIEQPLDSSSALGEGMAELQTLKPDFTGELLLRSVSRDQRVRAPCSVYTGSGFAAIVPAEARIVRIEFDGGKFMWHTEKGKHFLRLNVNLPPPDLRMTLSRARKLAAAAEILLDQKGCEIRLNGPHGTFDWRSVGPGLGGTNLASYLDIIHQSGKLAARLGLDPDLEVEVSSLMPYTEELTLATCDKPVPAGIPMTEEQIALHAGRLCAFLFLCELRLGPYLVLLVTVLVGQPTSEQGPMLKIVATPETLFSQVFDTEHDHVPDHVDGAFSGALEKLASRGVEHFLLAQAPDPSRILPPSVIRPPRSTGESV